MITSSGINISDDVLKQIVSQVIAECAKQAGDNSIPIEVSARHVHLSQKDVEALFGEGYQLTPKRELSQPGQFLCKERVTVLGPKGSFERVAVLGPTRPESQVEISRTDARQLGVQPVLRESGAITGTPGVFLHSDKGMVQLQQGVIVARNHIHMTSADAARLNVRDKQEVDVKVESERPLTFHKVLVRVSDSFSLSMHIDFDEANAVGLATDARGILITG